jgi:hypothetical protein
MKSKPWLAKRLVSRRRIVPSFREVSYKELSDKEK